MVRLFAVLTGFSMIAAGVYVEGLAGVLLTIAGLVPAVMGIANVSVLREVREERAHRREQARRPPLGQNDPAEARR